VITNKFENILIWFAYNILKYFLVLQDEKKRKETKKFLIISNPFTNERNA
jgi:hypothetical protein